MKMKIGRREFDITNKDKVLDNGACYQVTTQTYADGWFRPHPIISKTQFNKLIKEGKLELIEDKYAYTTADGREFRYRTYEFRVE